mmetsp:Transcript_15308/g.20272  ORF Transcript_15308/g.20272 Transcript_15308/m.20272 type:complete len:591 (+) Transcript_15308:20-1792(+)
MDVWHWQKKEELFRTLQGLEGKGYNNYRATLENSAWELEEGVWIIGDRIQGDAYAPASRFRVALGAQRTGLPVMALASREARVAAADWLCRRFVQTARRAGDDLRTETGGWGGQKGGEITMTWPSQFVLERNAVIVQEYGQIEVRFTIALPASGRSIEGHWAANIICKRLATLLADVFFLKSQDPGVSKMLQAHVDAVLDQQFLRAQLAQRGLIAFVAQGCILPRCAGNDDRPMSTNNAVAFDTQQLGSLRVSLNERRDGNQIWGLGLERRKVSLICGGGFHGKSTLLAALRVGCYDKIPGDGREGCVTDTTVSTIRSEDGRFVQAVDVSAFISSSSFPGGGTSSTKNFTTLDASGSTSQAAAVAEAIEAGAQCLLFDEDLSAINFMTKDARMRALVPTDPITPYLDRVRNLAEVHGISSILVVGGIGEYLRLADAVVLMENWIPRDVTAQVTSILPKDIELTIQSPPAAYFTPRTIQPTPPVGKVVARTRTSLQFGDNNELSLLAVDQLVEIGQTRAIAAALIALNSEPHPQQTFSQILDILDAALDNSLDFLSRAHGGITGDLVRPRRLEIAAAFNRLRTARFYQASS